MVARPSHSCLRLFLLALAIGGFLPSGAAQQGDRPDRPAETQLPPDIPIPPAPALSPQAALKTFKVAPGFRVELVASEPLVEAPVAIAFDPDGRIWVCEMRGYMPDVDGAGENLPVGRIVILEDTDGDGKMDKSTVFLDGLVLPRAVAFAHGGVLVAEPPRLWFCGPPGPDGRASSKTELLPDYAASDRRPEYLPNGLLWALDNWIYSAHATRRYRFDAAGKFIAETTSIRGQWGIAQDDAGRLFYNYNEDQLRADLIPFEYLQRNPDLHDPAGSNVSLTSDQNVFPVRVNPGTNRGYEKKTLRPDGTLRTHTAACGPAIYRGDLFPAEFRGNAFVCEPAGNLVSRDILEEKDGVLNARAAYDEAEFLASTDERFRPVNVATGPDGALYVVDMYRGLIQHRDFLTTYLREQTLSRGLDKPLDRGRIYRVVPESAKLAVLPKLADRSPAALVGRLSHPNGWWRDTAQRLLVEGGSPAAVPLLLNLARDGRAASPGRLHALWTLQGMGKLDAATVRALLPAADPILRAAAVRLSEGFLGREPALLAQVLASVNDPDFNVRLQVALTLGQVSTPSADKTMAALLAASGDQPLLRDAVISGLHGRELEFLSALLADPAWARNNASKAAALGSLARCVLNERAPERVSRLLQMVATEPAEVSWRRNAMMAALAEAATERPPRNERNKSIPLPASLPALDVLASSAEPQTREQFQRIANVLDWPGKARAEVTSPRTQPLTGAQRVLFEKGKVTFEQTCAACHQTTGLGQAGLAPPLVNSPWVLGSEQRLIRIALHGLDGNVMVDTQTYNMDMPPMGALGDEELASILTYIRHRWGNSAPAVETAKVAEVRSATRTRTGSWSAPELLAVP